MTPTRRLSLFLPLLPALLACPPNATVKPTVDAAEAAPRAQVAQQEPARQPGQTAAEADAAADEALLRQGIPPLYFELDSAQLKPESQQVLAELAEVLRRRTQVAVKIEGHTCELGTAEYNLALGLRRAQVAREYLHRMGVSAQRLQTVSYGEERLAGEAVSEDQHALNRRSELRLELQAHAER